MPVCMCVTSSRGLRCGFRKPHARPPIAQPQQECEHTGQADAVVGNHGRAGFVWGDHSPVTDGVTGVDAPGEFACPCQVTGVAHGLGKVDQELRVPCQAVALRWAGTPACPVHGSSGLRGEFGESLFAGVLPNPQQEGADS